MFRAECARRGMKTMIKQRWLKITIVVVLILSLGVMITPLFNLREMARPTTALAVQPQTANAIAAGADAAQLVGDYSGEVQLQATVAGGYSDTLVAPPPAAGTPDLGSIDLALNLSQN